eukprot:scaffold2131_cov384-Prasinococcus_capsulatus_cf.AAC.17
MTPTPCFGFADRRIGARRGQVVSAAATCCCGLAFLCSGQLQPRLSWARAAGQPLAASGALQPSRERRARPPACALPATQTDATKVTASAGLRCRAQPGPSSRARRALGEAHWTGRHSGGGAGPFAPSRTWATASHTVAERRPGEGLPLRRHSSSHPRPPRARGLPAAALSTLPASAPHPPSPTAFGGPRGPNLGFPGGPRAGRSYGPCGAWGGGAQGAGATLAACGRWAGTQPPPPPPPPPHPQSPPAPCPGTLVGPRWAWPAPLRPSVGPPPSRRGGDGHAARDERSVGAEPARCVDAGAWRGAPRRWLRAGRTGACHPVVRATRSGVRGWAGGRGWRGRRWAKSCSVTPGRALGGWEEGRPPPVLRAPGGALVQQTHRTVQGEPTAAWKWHGGHGGQASSKGEGGVPRFKPSPVHASPRQPGPPAGPPGAPFPRPPCSGLRRQALSDAPRAQLPSRRRPRARHTPGGATTSCARWVGFGSRRPLVTAAASGKGGVTAVSVARRGAGCRALAHTALRWGRAGGAGAGVGAQTAEREERPAPLRRLRARRIRRSSRTCRRQPPRNAHAAIPSGRLA